MLTLDRIPPAGGKVRVAGAAEAAGGQVATAVLGAQRLGLRTAFAGVVGDDREGEVALGPLTRSGVDCSSVLHLPGVPTRAATVLVETASGERRVLEERDAGLRYPPERGEACAADARLLLVDTTHPEAALRAAQAMRKRGGAVLLDADGRWDGVEELLRATDFPVVPRSLAEEFGSGSVERGLAWMASFGATLAIATLGDGGAMAVGSAVAQGAHSPAFACEVRDTTGAGDAFRAGLAFALCEGASAERALAVANATASLNCEGPGAQAGLPDRSRLEERLRGRELPS